MQQNIILTIRISVAKTPDNTFMLTLVRCLVKLIPNVVSKVNNIESPQKIVINRRTSSVLHQVYIPNAIKAHITKAIIVGIIFIFITLLFIILVYNVGGIGGAAGANSDAKSARLAAGSHVAIP